MYLVRYRAGYGAENDFYSTKFGVGVGPAQLPKNDDNDDDDDDNDDNDEDEDNDDDVQKITEIANK